MLDADAGGAAFASSVQPMSPRRRHDPRRGCRIQSSERGSRSYCSTELSRMRKPSVPLIWSSPAATSSIERDRLDRPDIAALNRRATCPPPAASVWPVSFHDVWRICRSGSPVGHSSSMTSALQQARIAPSRGAGDLDAELDDMRSLHGSWHTSTLLFPLVRFRHGSRTATSRVLFQPLEIWRCYAAGFCHSPS